MFDLHHDERLLFSVSALSFVGLTLLIAVIPAIRAERANEPLPTSEPMTAKERQGLKVYVNEGCAYCHTQQVRPVSMDDKWGRPSVAGDYARLERPGVWRQTPAVLGSERTGPDLSNVGERQPGEMWHYIHLYNPRAVVSDSVMPSFPWLFQQVDAASSNATEVPMSGAFGPDQGTVVTTERAEALVAYLTSLKQAPLPSAEEQKESTGASGETTATSGLSGARIYSNSCASCHQSNGKGLPGTFPPLKDDPVVTQDDPKRHVEIVLEGLEGKKIQGTSYSAKMPAFAGQLSDSEVAAVVNHERTSWGNDAPTVTAEEVAEIREMLAEEP
jgi:cytochrome c oxidase cbb3-type subunit 2